VYLLNRSLQFLFLIIILLACKPSGQVSQSVQPYEEDLSGYWKDLPEIEDKETAVADEILPASPAPIGHIRMELDSVNSMIVSRNSQIKKWDGYTIQVYSGLSREAAYSAKRQVERTMPELEVRLEYFQPSYRVKCGAYFDQLAAHRVHQELLTDFPKALLLPEKIPLNAVNTD